MKINNAKIHIIQSCVDAAHTCCLLSHSFAPSPTTSSPAHLIVVGISPAHTRWVACVRSNTASWYIFLIISNNNDIRARRLMQAASFDSSIALGSTENCITRRCQCAPRLPRCCRTHRPTGWWHKRQRGSSLFHPSDMIVAAIWFCLRRNVQILCGTWKVEAEEDDQAKRKKKPCGQMLLLLFISMICGQYPRFERWKCVRRPGPTRIVYKNRMPNAYCAAEHFFFHLFIIILLFFVCARATRIRLNDNKKL